VKMKKLINSTLVASFVCGLICKFKNVIKKQLVF